MKYILIDGNAFCYRAFYAIRELRNSKGEPTNAVYGFITMLQKVMDQVQPEGVAMTFDLKGPTFRHERYDQYKIQRSPMPEDLVKQIPVIKQVVRAMNIPIYELQGYEADDVIATLACYLAQHKKDAYIVTGDKDALQLVGEHIWVLNPSKDNLIYDSQKVHERFGVGPERVVDVMALMGDASDNIPGVMGVGEKTATKLIAQFGSIENLYQNLDQVSSEKLRENLTKHHKDAVLSKELATIDRKVPLKIELDSLRLQSPDVAQLRKMYQELEFRTLLKSLESSQPSHSSDAVGLAESSQSEYILITEDAEAASLVDKLKKQSVFAFDFETTSTDPLKAKPVGVSFCFEKDRAYYVAFDISGQSEIQASAFLESMRIVFESQKISKIGQNIKYETMILKNFDIHLQGISFDTMIASYCLNTSKHNHNLEDISFEHTGITLTSIESIIGTGRSQITMDQADLTKVYRYGCQDSEIVYKLYPILNQKLEADKALSELFKDIEMPLVPILAGMEYEGIEIDPVFLDKLSHQMDGDLSKLTKSIHEKAGEEFNINSPKQLAEILFVKLKLPIIKKTKTGPSTDAQVLAALSDKHPLVESVLHYRELSKLKSTYVDALSSMADSRNHRIHTSFNQTVTATGRLSSSDPNLQNIPVRTEEGRKIRRAFIAGKGKSFVSADYSQIELRVLAHLCADKGLIKAFNEGMDIHRFTASSIFGVSMESVTDAMRYSAKTVNFGVLYGMGAFSLAKSLDMSIDSAKDFIKAYFERYPKIKVFLDATIDQAKTSGYVETLFGRRRYIPEIKSKDARLRSFAERTAINAPIQGTASDIIKIAMKRVSHELSGDFKDCKMLLQVHDELLFECPNASAKDFQKILSKCMSEAVALSVPLNVSVKTGPNWYEMK